MSRRGIALALVLVVLVLTALTATTVLFSTRATLASGAGSQRAAQARATAWSAIQGVAAEFGAAREAILAGQRPDPTARFDLSDASAGGTHSVAQLVPFGDASAEIQLAQSENAKLDINRATAPMLAAIGLAEPVAAAIVARRGTRPFSSVEELLTIPGVTPDMLYGKPASQDGREASDQTSLNARPLASLLTAFSFDAPTRAGIAGDPEDLLRVPASKEIAEELKSRGWAIPPEAQKAIETIAKRSKPIDRTSELVAILQADGVPTRVWGELLDMIAVGDDLFPSGRVDINSAPAEVLTAIPGFTAESAAAIVQKRDSVSPSDRCYTTWPLAQGLLGAPEFAKACDWLTTRSTQWRVRVEAGEATAAGGAKQESSLRTLASYDAIIDIAGDRPRIAYLRDVSLLPAAREIGAAAIAAEQATPTSGPQPADAAPAAPAPPPRSSSRQLSNDAKLKADASLNLGARRESGTAPSGAEPKAAPAPGLAPRTLQDRRRGRWSTGGGS
jgi:DNA uptake protein ComE-like DNA-binding protein